MKKEYAKEGLKQLGNAVTRKLFLNGIGGLGDGCFTENLDEFRSSGIAEVFQNPKIGLIDPIDATGMFDLSEDELVNLADSNKISSIVFESNCSWQLFFEPDRLEDELRGLGMIEGEVQSKYDSTEAVGAVDLDYALEIGIEVERYRLTHRVAKSPTLSGGDLDVNQDSENDMPNSYSTSPSREVNVRQVSLASKYKEHSEDAWA
jgi:hypothetical protein